MSDPVRISLTSYGQPFLERSWMWLNDPEIKALTLTPDFTREDQKRFYSSLKNRSDYWIWGLELDGEPIGAAGLKNPRNSVVEYWGYIGEKRYWGMRLGPQILELIEAEAKSLGFRQMDLQVSIRNLRARRLYTACGFVQERDGDVISMVKDL